MTLARALKGLRNPFCGYDQFADIPIKTDLEDDAKVKSNPAKFEILVIET